MKNHLARAGVATGIMAMGLAVGADAQTNWTVAKRYTMAESTNIEAANKIGNTYIGFGGAYHGGKIFTSTDGINWTFRANSPATYNSVASTGSRYVAIRNYDGAGGYWADLGVSSNGITWTQKTLGFNIILSSIVWSGSQLIAVGQIQKKLSSTNTMGSYGVILSSADGITWAQRYEDAVLGTELKSVIWTGTKFIAVGNNGRCVSSTNGTTWTPVFLPIPANLCAVTWTGAFIVATGNNGGSFVSADGVSWTIAGTPVLTTTYEGLYLYSLLWSGKSLVQVGRENNGYNTYFVNTSLDGINWNISPVILSSYYETRVYSLIFNGTQFIAYGDGYSTTDSLKYSLILTAPVDSVLGVSPLAKRPLIDYSILSHNNSGPSKLITYSLAETAPVSLRLLDLRGREVFSGINSIQGPGSYSFRMTTAAIAPGRYVQVFEAGKFVKREMVNFNN